MPGLVKPTKMSEVHHQAPRMSQSSTNGPPQTSQGPPGHYIGASSAGGSRRVTIVAGGLSHLGMVDRQSSYGGSGHHLPMDHGDMFGSRASISLADDLLRSHSRRHSDADPRDHETSTAVLDAAILDLTRRRLAMAGDPSGAGSRDREESEWKHRRSVSYAHSASSLAARQQQLQHQQKELEQRQRELEIQRQQLMAGMQEHSKATSLLQARQRGNSMAASSSQQQWWVCQVCNSKAFASHDEAMQHELSCCPEPQKFESIAGAMPIPSDHHIATLPGYPISPTAMDTLELSANSFTMMKDPMPLSMNSDKDWLTPLHCFVRRHCVQVFTATQNDVSTPSKGKRKPIQVGQVGIRCPHCHSEDSTGKTRERGSVYYPTSISSIYNATMNLLQRHLHNCSAVPAEIMRRYETLKSDDARSGTSKRYWIESALSLGLVDTTSGIRYSAHSPPPLPSLSSQQHSTGSFSVERRNSNDFFSSSSNAVADLNRDSEASAGNCGTTSPPLDPPDTTAAATTEGSSSPTPTAATVVGDDIPNTEQSLTDSAPLVTPDDEPYSTKFSFHLISQMQPCVFTEADRLGKRKGLPAGFPGLACRHCFGGYGSGRFFPSSIKTLSDTSKTLNVLHNHMMRCRKCPTEVRDTLEKLRTTHDEERGKMKFGSQKAFFARVWERLHKNGTVQLPVKRKAVAPPADSYSPVPPGYPMLPSTHAYVDARYFGLSFPSQGAGDHLGHASFSVLDTHPIELPDHRDKRRRSA